MEDGRPLRLGYVGCGFLAQKVHLPNIAALPGLELAALAEVREGLGRRVQERFGVARLYRDHRDLAADPALDVAAVSGHYSAQGEIAIDLLRAGKDVFMEKPMAISVAQAERMLTAERESGRRLMVGYMKRYDAGYATVKALLGDPELRDRLGALRLVRAHEFGGDWLGGLDTPLFESDEPVPPVTDSQFPDWLPGRLRGSYLLYLQEYAHHVNLVRWFLDADEVAVRAVDLDDRDGYTGAAILRMGDARVVLETGETAAHVWDEHVQLYFEQGWIRATSAPLLLRNVPAEVEVYTVADGRGRLERIGAEWTWAYREELAHFADCIRHGRPFRSPAADAMADVLALERIYRIHAERG